MSEPPYPEYLPQRQGPPQANYAPVEQSAAAPAPAYLLGDQSAYGYVGMEVEQTRIWEYLRVVGRHKWLVGTVFSTACVLGLFYTLAATPMYRATTLLQIQPKGPNILSFDEVQESAGQAQAYNDFFQTQYDILSSRALARRAINELGLAENPEFNPALRERGFLSRTKHWVVSMLGAEESGEGSERAAERELLRLFRDSVEVSPRRKSFLVELSFLATDPEIAADVTTVMASEYIDLTLDQRIQAASQGRGFIAKQLGVTKARLEQSEVDLQEFAKGRDIGALEQEEKVIHSRLADLNERFTQAQGERIALQSVYLQASGPDSGRLSEVVESPLIRNLKEQLAQLQSERAQLLQTFTTQYPAVRRLSARIGGIQMSIAQERDSIVAGIISRFEAAKEQEALLAAQLEEQKSVVVGYEEKSVAFKIMRREVDTNRDIYENLLRRLKEVEVTEAVRASNVSVIDASEVPLEPDKPNMPMNMAFSMLLGLVGGVGVAFAREYLDDSIKTPEEVESILRLPTLGAIPEFVELQGENAADTSPDLQVALQPTSSGAEAIRTLRASLFLSSAGGLPSRLLFTSSRPAEGKTCIATNLAIALVQMGRKIVLIDCDLRRPRVHLALNMAQTPGVTNFLTGNGDLSSVIREGPIKGLDIVTAGPIPPNPVDLIDSSRMDEFLRQLEERYDHVLVDAPPALGFADVPLLTKRMGGGCLIVARAGETPKAALKHTSDYLMRMQSKVMGVVLNRVSTQDAGYSYYGYYGYQQPYGPDTDGVAPDRLEPSA